MALLLRDAFLPNLVQTLRAILPSYTGPFANIAHSGSSVADSIALSTCECCHRGGLWCRHGC